MSQAELLAAPAVNLVNNRPSTTSLAIAKSFDKQHTHVMRDIRNLLEDCPADFTAHNFVESEYTDSTGRTLPMFTVFFDGFILLVMGYTGKKALQMKLAYIEAFNAMKAELARRHHLPYGWQPRKGARKRLRLEEHCTWKEAEPVEAAVNIWCREKGLRRIDALAAIRIHFGLRVFNRPPRRLHAAILEWIDGQRGLIPQRRQLEERREPLALPEEPEKHARDVDHHKYPKLARRLAECHGQLKRFCAALNRQDEDHGDFPKKVQLMADLLKENLEAVRVTADTMQFWLNFLNGMVGAVKK